jgi:mRNA-degrading endonuclease RelE of RelBE toxin-antitoxin system
LKLYSQYRGLDKFSTTTLKSLGISSRDKSILRIQYEENDKTQSQVEKEKKDFLGKLTSPRKEEIKEEIMQEIKVITSPRKEEIVVSPRKEFVATSTPKTEVKEVFTAIPEEKETEEQKDNIVEILENLIEKEDSMTVSPRNEEVENIQQEEEENKIEEDLDVMDIEASTSSAIFSVEEWLNSFSMSKYLSNFTDNDVNDLEVIKALTKDEIQEDLGVKSFGDRKRILLEIENLKKVSIPIVQPTKVQKITQDKKPIPEEKSKVKIEETPLEFRDTSLKLVPLTGIDAEEVKVFKASQKKAFTKDEIKNEKFELTAKDLKELGAFKTEDQKEKESMLMTSKMREIEAKKKERKYEQTLIRLRIGEYVLQGTFLPSHKIASVKQLIEKCVVNPDTKIYLYQSPPLQKYQDEKTLKDCGLVPAAILNIGLVDKTDKPIQLKDDIISYCQDFGDEILPDKIQEETEKKEKKETKIEIKETVEKKDKKEKDPNKKPSWLKLK